MTASWDITQRGIMFTPILLLHAARTTEKYYFDVRTEHHKQRASNNLPPYRLKILEDVKTNDADNTKFVHIMQMLHL